MCARGTWTCLLMPCPWLLTYLPWLWLALRVPCMYGTCGGACAVTCVCTADGRFLNDLPCCSNGPRSKQHVAPKGGSSQSALPICRWAQVNMRCSRARRCAVAGTRGEAGIANSRFHRNDASRVSTESGMGRRPKTFGIGFGFVSCPHQKLEKVTDVTVV